MLQIIIRACFKSNFDDDNDEAVLKEHDWMELLRGENNHRRKRTRAP